ncbi:MAG: metal ABC transporter solute-binding protein, Zn/Mn family [Alphaproteobacteria bacterium]
MKRLGLAVAVLVAGLGAARSEARAGDATAVATVGMIGDVAQNVAGDCVSIETLMGPGVDPHLYRPSAGDVRLLQGSDAILYVGYALEGQLGDVLERLGARKPTLAVAPASIDRDELITMPDDEGVDPHLWMDAALWARTVPTIADTLTEVVPDCAEAMRAEALDYRRQLAALDDWIAASVASVPADRRVLVTAHDAFAYYGRAYDIDVRGIQGISTEAEAGIKDIRDAAERVVELGVPAVFVETTVNPRTIQALVDAAADRGHEVRVGGELFSDAMGAPDTAEGSYIGMLRANTVRIVTGLGGEPAPWPEELHPWAERFGVDVARN